MIPLNDDDDQPSPNTVSIAGKVVSASNGLPIANASFKIYDPASGPGGSSVIVTTNANGDYIAIIEDLVASISVNMEATAPSYFIGVIKLSIELGEDYDGQDFSQMPSMRYARFQCSLQKEPPPSSGAALFVLRMPESSSIL